MKDNFGSKVSSELSAFVDAQLLALRFGDKEKQVLRLFYDERLKVRRQKVPKFHIYAQLCDGKRESDWPTVMIDADRALHNLMEIRCVQEVQPSLVGGLSQTMVGQASVLYELTAKGFEILQSWHPPIALKLRAWIAVLPPWFVLVGTVAGGITAAWKLIEFAKWVAEKLGQI